MKKVMGFLLTFVLLIGTIALPVSAEENEYINVRMSGIFHQYNTIEGIVDTNMDLTDAEYSWLSSNTQSGTYNKITPMELQALNNDTMEPVGEPFMDATDTKLILQRGSDYIIDNTVTSREGDVNLTYVHQNDAGIVQSFAGKWIKYRVTIDGINYDSEPRRVDDLWGQISRNINMSDLKEFHMTTPEENIFTVGGQDFILLDTTESDTAHFLVLAKNIYGAAHEGKSGTFSFMQEFLDNEFKAFGLDDCKLPDEILDAIDYDVYWKVGMPRYWLDTGAGGNIGVRGCPATQGGIVVPSWDEVVKYSDKIGLADEAADWQLRDPNVGNPDGEAAFYIRAGEAGFGEPGSDITEYFSTSNTDKGIRPMFYLNREFFKDQPMDLNRLGSNVAKAIHDTYAKDELRGMYDEKTLQDVFGYSSDFSVSADVTRGSVVSGGTVNVSLTVSNELSSRVESTVLVAVYNAENQLVSAKVQDVQLPEKGETAAEMTLSDVPGGAGNFMIAYLLDRDAYLYSMAESEIYSE